MKTVWFEQRRWIYRPVSRIGWLLIGATIVFLTPIFLTIDSVLILSATRFTVFFPFFAPISIVLYWIASKSSLKKP